jgi:hypothetical protein
MRTAMRVSGVMLDGLASGAIGASVGTDGCLICVGILSAFIIDIEEWTRRENQGVVGKQMAMTSNDHPGLTAARQMQCDHYALEKALAFCRPAEGFRRSWQIAQHDRSCVLHE